MSEDKQYSLDEILSRITPENRHAEIDFGSPRQSKASAALAQFIEAMDLDSPRFDDDYSLRLAEMRALLEPRLKVGFKRLSPDAFIPTKAHASDSGFDVVASEDVIIEPGATVVVPTGIAVELPEGYEAQVRPRSGVTSKTKLRVQLGTIDNGYSGEVGVIVDNIRCDEEFISGGLDTIDGEIIPCDDYGMTFANTEAYIIRKGDRIAQLVIQRLPDVVAYEVDTLGESERGAQGFGSSGVTREDLIQASMKEDLTEYGALLGKMAKEVE